MSDRRCGVTSAGGLGCCRPEGHPGDHCAHDSDRLTGTPGVIVVGRGPLGGVSLGRCDGTRNPVGDRIVHSQRPGAIESRTELVLPEGDTHDDRP